MKKKNIASSKDKSDWLNFIKKTDKLFDKDLNFYKNIDGFAKDKVRKLDLHGCSLEQANKKVKKFTLESFKVGYKKLLIVTGKGLRSKVYDDPYKSENMNILKNSVPDYIKRDQDLLDVISKISEADIKDGGEGAFYIFLKK